MGVPGREAIGVACVMVDVWDPGSFGVGAAGELRFSAGEVRVKFGQSVVWVSASIKQIGHHCEEDPCPVNVRV